MCDNETNNIIIELILKSCNDKYIIAKLIQKHYLLVWLTNLLEKNDISHKQQDINKEFFWKLVTLFCKIWEKLGNRNIENYHDIDNNIISKSLPLTFLNQIFIIIRIILRKLTENYVLLNDSKQENLQLFERIECISNFFNIIRKTLEHLHEYQKISSRSLNFNTCESYKLNKDDFENFIRIVKSFESDSCFFEFFLIILLSDLKHSLFNPSSSSIWCFFVNYLSKKDTISKVMEAELEKFSLINKILDSIKKNLIIFNLLKANNKISTWIEESEKIEFFSFINLNEFLKNLKNHIKKREEFELINEKYKSVCELLSNEKNSNKRYLIDSNITEIHVKKSKKD